MSDRQRRFRLQRAAHVLGEGGIIAYPTEAVFGLGCDPLNPAAVYRLLALKQRPASKGLILIAADLAQLQPYILELPREREREIREQAISEAATAAETAAKDEGLSKDVVNELRNKILGVTKKQS